MGTRIKKLHGRNGGSHAERPGGFKNTQQVRTLTWY